ncbi:MAG: deoxyribonuclease IV [Acidobacteria bacterium]|nr:MAG: deoxyribonuclease IV [Acidobacteriota bacterium]
MRIGVHTSIAGALVNAIHRAERLNCQTVQIFSRNPRGWIARPLSPADVKAFCRARDRAGIWPLIIHGVYLINLAAPDPLIREKSIVAFREEIKRALRLKADFLVIHPGSAKNGSPEEGIARCIRSVKKAVRRLKLRNLTILIENTAGQGGQIGCTFEQVAAILDGLDGLPIGCCLDTAHTFAAGYDIATPRGCHRTLSLIAATIGLETLHVIHANDTRVPLGGAVDRHWHIGRGHIDLAAFGYLLNHPIIGCLPFILETPKTSDQDDRRNLATLRRLAHA